MENASRLAEEPELTSRHSVDADEFREPLFELTAESTAGQPEVQTGIDQAHDLLFVKDPAGVRGRRLAGHVRLRRPSAPGVCAHLFEDLGPEGGNRRLGVTGLGSVVDVGLATAVLLGRSSRRWGGSQNHGYLPP